MERTLLSAAFDFAFVLAFDLRSYPINPSRSLRRVGFHDANLPWDFDSLRVPTRSVRIADGPDLEVEIPALRISSGQAMSLQNA